jgi:hypothetical protein
MEKGSRFGHSGQAFDKWDKVEILLVEDNLCASSGW